MPVYGLIVQRAHGHAVTTILIAMVAMLLTGISYGRMARVYPSGGSAFTYVGAELHPAFGYITGWAMAMDYMLNPVVCTILCSKFILNFLPILPYPLLAILFICLFTGLNVVGIRTSAKINAGLTAALGIVIVIFLAAAVRYVLVHTHVDSSSLLRPFYNPQTFSATAVLGGTSLAVLTYIGFDGISTLAEEVDNPRRNILLATVLVCLITGVLASIEVYAAQLIWPSTQPFPDVDTAFTDVAGRAAGPWLFNLITIALLVATVGSGIGSQLGAARLLYGMGRDNAIPKRFFGAIEPKHRIPRNNVLFVGLFALVGTSLLSFERAVELLNFGALLAFMGVNAASFTRYVIRQGSRSWSHIGVPIVGFTVCFLLWLNLSVAAKLAGVAWMLLGTVYGAIRTRGFRTAVAIPEP
jgi:amino acid transporter